MTNGDIMKLKDIHQELGDFVAGRGKTATYKTNGNDGMGFCLKHTPKIAIQDTIFYKDSSLGVHTHPDNIEILVVYSGKVEVTLEGETKTLGVGDSIRIEKGEEHSAEIPEDSWMIGITIPEDSGYP